MGIIYLNTSDIKDNLNNVVLAHEVKKTIFPILREKVTQFATTKDSIKVVSLNIVGISLNIILYRDYNNYDWCLESKDSLSGNFSSIKPVIVKLAKGILFTLHKYKGKRSVLSSSKSYADNRNYYMFNDEYFFNVTEICDNIVQYEYIKAINISFDTETYELTIIDHDYS